MRFCEQLEARLDDELSAPETTAFDAHLIDCDACRIALMKWNCVVSVLRDPDDGESEPLEPLVNTATDSGAARLEDAFAQQCHRQRFRRRRVWMAVAAVVLVGVTLAVWRSREKDPHPDTGDVVGMVSSGVVSVERITHSTPNPEIHVEMSEFRLAETETLRLPLASSQIGADRGASFQLRSAAKGDVVVMLRRGRVVADVPGRKHRASFVVDAGDCRVVVRGTRFSVERTDEMTVVSVSRGRVDVHLDDGERISVKTGTHWSRLDSGAMETRSLLPDEMTDMSRLLIAEEVGVEDQDEGVASDIDDGEMDRGKAILSRRADAGDRRFDIWKTWILEGETGRARAELVRYLRSTPNDTQALSLLASLEKREKNWAAAVAAYRRIIDGVRGTDASFARFQAGVLLQEKLATHDEAADMFGAFVANHPGHPLVADAMLRQARSLQRSGQGARAKALLLKISEAHPGSVPAIEARKQLSADEIIE